MINEDEVGTQIDQVQNLPMIKVGIWEEGNVRRRRITAGLDELVESIKRIGLLQPIVVRSEDGEYEVVIGQRRYLAAKELGWETIPAIVRDYDVLKGKIASMSENIQRRDISGRDKAVVCKYLLDEFGTPKAVAEELGITEVTVRKWLGYHAVPEKLKKFVDEKKISPTEAIRISQNIPDESKAIKIAEKMVEANLTKPQKDRVIDEIEEEPEVTVERIFKRAEERKVQREITFVLPPKAAESLDTAASEEDKEPATLARDVVVTWLRDQGYFGR